MRSLIVRLALLPLILLAALVPQARAQEEDATQKFKMPCAQVLKLGLDKFMDVYDEKTGDGSTYGMKQGFGYYAECKRADNDAHARALTVERRKQSDEVREAFMKLGNAAWTMTYVEAGGGTMYALASVGAYATREDYMATIIAALAMTERKQPLLRRRADASLRKAQAMMSRRSRMPTLEFFSKGDRAGQRKLYQDSVREARAAIAQLRALIAALPDAAAERTAKRVVDELDTGE